ncbi:unnamed protein product [Scytosiphon promiscuus]
MSSLYPSRLAHATPRANAAASMVNRSLRRAAVGLAALVMLLACCTSTVDAKEVKGLSFYPPFQSFNARGDRTVSSFSFVGATAAKQSFVRLTPDLKDHFGSLFSRLSGRFTEKAGPPGGQFSMVMSFRVSGSVEKAHGKYLAVVLGNPDMIRRTGDTYGLPANFIGVGVVISPRPPADFSELTADPSKPAGPRQFVSFIANNGTRSTEEVRVLANSCASTLRYYEGRDDFNFLKSSRIRLGYYEGDVTLEVDSRNSGIWRKCITTKLPDMPAGWLDRAGVAIVGETAREVSNNHDVMSLEVRTTGGIQRLEGFDKHKVDGDVLEGDAAEAESDAFKRKKMYTLKAHLEHEFDSVERILKDSVDKLADINEDMQRRIAKLEKDLSSEVFSRLNTRVKDIEQRVTKNAAPALEGRIKVAEEMWAGEIGDSMEVLLKKNTGYRVPFILILGVVVLLFAASVQQYRKLMRSNFLGGMR